MSSIHILEDTVINKITAGEVVERPSSIVKELIENAIDAQATTIHIELEDGGKKLILIKDNGFGISHNDLTLILKRHSTSKIKTLSDLFSVSSMGFRGEALSSISAVSRFTLISKKKEMPTAYKLSYDDLKQQEITTWHNTNGTQIRIEDLFYNIPVRKKFLKSAQAEFAHCLETVRAFALAYPQHGFSLTHNGKEKCCFPPHKAITDLWHHKNDLNIGEETLRQRANYLFDKTLSHSLLYIKAHNHYGSIEALISPPGLEKITTKNLLYFVNGRWVKDQVLRYGILRGYHSHLLKGRYPQVICYLKTDPSLIDVNVHPSKTQLRFQYADEVQGLLARSIREKLRQGNWIHQQPDIQSFSVPPLSKTITEKETQKETQKETTTLKNELDFPGDLQNKLSLEKPNSNTKQNNPPLTVRLNKQRQTPTSIFRSSSTQIQNNKSSLSATTLIDWDNAIYIGSFGACYLLFEIEAKLLLVDQHAFHERILYEKLIETPSLYQDSQQLLVPELIDLQATELSTLLDKQKELENKGFKFKIINNTSIEVQAVPVLLVHKDLSIIFQSLGQSFSYEDSTQTLCSPLLATLACHGAIKAGDTLSQDQLSQLIQQAKTVNFYLNCPHGRRVLKWFKHHELEKWFDRI